MMNESVEVNANTLHDICEYVIMTETVNCQKKKEYIKDLELSSKENVSKEAIEILLHSVQVCQAQMRMSKTILTHVSEYIDKISETDILYAKMYKHIEFTHNRINAIFEKYKVLDESCCNLLKEIH